MTKSARCVHFQSGLDITESDQACSGQMISKSDKISTALAAPDHWRGIVMGEPVPSGEVGEAVLVRGYPALVRNERARLWIARAVRQLAAARPARPFTTTLAVDCRAWTSHLPSSPATELLGEALERAGIVADARQIREAHVYLASDRARPRLEVRLRVLP
jgi:hypothetical protein